MSSSGKLITGGIVVDGSLNTADIAAGALSQFTTATTGGGGSTTSATFVPIVGATVTLNTQGGLLLIEANGSIFHTTATAQNYFGISVDGGAVTMVVALTIWSVGMNLPWSFSYILQPAAGNHTVQLHWQTSAGTLVMNNGQMFMMEIKR